MFRNIDRLFVFSFKNGIDDPTRNSCNDHYMPLVEIKYFNAFIDNKPFFNQSIKNKQEPYKKRNEMSRNNGYTTGNVLDYLYNQNIINLLV